MASSKIKGITIKIDADTQGLDTALRSVESKGKDAARELREIKTAMNTVGETVELWTQKQKVLSTALDESKKKLKFLEEAQEQVNKQFQDKTITEEQYRAFQRETEYARAAVEKYEKQLSEANQKVEEFAREADKAADDVGELGDNTEEAGKQAQKASDGGLTAMKVALGNLIADGVRVAAGAVKDFTEDVIETGKVYEASMSNVAAISGATSEELERLKAKAEEMGATTKFTASESADAFGYMALAGWKVNDMLSGIDGVLSLAAASNMDLATASDIVTDYLTAFGLTAQDSGHFVDIMTYAMANSNTTTALLGEAYKNCAATAASMGYSVEDTTAVLMTMANAGIKGGEAGTALNAIMTRLATDTKDCATNLAEYGVEIYDSKGNMQSLSSILEGVSGVWENLTDQQQANMAKTIAGTNHYAALQTIMNGLSDQAAETGMSFGDYTAALEKCDGAAQEMSTTMIDNLAGDMTILDSAIDGMKISLSKELNPALRDIVQYVTKEMPNIQKSIEPAAKTAISGLEFVIKNTPKAIQTAKNITPVVIGIGAAFAAWKIAGIVQSAATAVQALNLTMLANPAVAVTAGIVALTAAIVALKLKSDEQKGVAAEVAKEYEGQFKAIQDTREAMADLRDEYQKNADEIVAESDRTRELWAELDKLTDSSGRVLEKDKERAQYILGELNKALGTEYNMTDDQIDGYQRLSAEIDNVIAKKEAELLLDQYREMNTANIQLAADSKSEYETHTKLRDDLKAQKDEAYKAYEEISGWDSEVYTPSRYIENWKKGGTSYGLTKKGYEAALAAEELNQKYQNETTLAREARTDYLTAMSYMDKLDEANKAYYEGRYSDLKDILYASKDADKEMLKNRNGTLDEMNAAWKNSLDKNLSDLKLALDSGRQQEIDAVLEAMEETVKYGKQAGMDSSDAFSDEFKKIVQEMLDREPPFDISNLASWAKDSGIDVGDIFGGDYTKVVQEQLNKGYDINDLLIWGINSGIDVGNVFEGEFREIYQKSLNNGFDISSLIEWATNNSQRVGDVFGYGFQTAVTKYLYDTNDLIYNSINSPGDAALYKEEKYQTGYAHGRYTNNATGTFLNIGHEGIVAEAGPELLQVMNGGVKVTPLSRNVKNTPVSLSEGAGGQRITYEYITVNAVVNNDYDVRRLGERLMAEKKSIEISKGLT